MIASSRRSSPTAARSHVVNARNNGAIPNLPDDAMVEVLAEVNGHGVMPMRAGPLPEALAAHLRHYVAVQKQMVKAALSGERRDVCTRSCSTR